MIRKMISDQLLSTLSYHFPNIQWVPGPSIDDNWFQIRTTFESYEEWNLKKLESSVQSWWLFLKTRIFLFLSAMSEFKTDLFIEIRIINIVEIVSNFSITIEKERRRS